MEDSEEIYEDLIDILINNQPLTSTRINEYSDAIRINRQIVDNMHNIRRYLEIQDEDNILQEDEPINNINRLLNNMFDFSQPNLFNINNQRSNINIDQENDNNNDSVEALFPEADINIETNVRTYLPNVNINPEFNLENLFGSDMFSDSMINTLMTLFLEGRTTINEQEFEDVKITLTEDEFNKLNNIILSDENINDYINKDCNICMDEYKKDETVINLDCKHIFHKDCIKNWLLNEKVSCPVCRKDTREMIK